MESHTTLSRATVAKKMYLLPRLDGMSEKATQDEVWFFAHTIERLQAAEGRSYREAYETALCLARMWAMHRQYGCVYAPEEMRRLSEMETSVFPMKSAKKSH